MFRPETRDPMRFPAAQATGERAHGERLRLVDPVHGKGPDEVLASTCWVLAHGRA